MFGARDRRELARGAPAALPSQDAEPVPEVILRRRPDRVDPSKGFVIPQAVRTDGRWIWSDDLTHYVKTYGLAPELPFLDYVREAEFVMPDVPTDTVRSAAELFFS